MRSRTDEISRVHLLAFEHPTPKRPALSQAPKTQVKETIMTAISKAINEVEGKVAIVTGAASGIGRSITELLHARGAKVIAEDINPEVERLKRPGIVPLVAD